MGNNERIIADMQIVEFTKNHNIHLMSMKPIISFLRDVEEYDNIEDLKGGLKFALYDIECLDDLLHDNLDLLWKIKEYHETLTLQKLTQTA